MDNVSLQKASGDGNVSARKSQTIADLEKLVSRMQSALESVTSNEKLKAKRRMDQEGVEEPDRNRRLVGEDVFKQDDDMENLDERGKVKPMQSDDSTLKDTSPDMVVCLQKENRVLMECLELSCAVSMKALRRVEDLKEQQVELERCLSTLQTEKNLLQDEETKLHREYIHLCTSVTQWLTEGTTALREERDVFGGSTHRSPAQRASGAIDDREGAARDSLSKVATSQNF